LGLFAAPLGAALAACPIPSRRILAVAANAFSDFLPWSSVWRYTCPSPGRAVAADQDRAHPGSGRMPKRFSTATCACPPPTSTRSCAIGTGCYIADTMPEPAPEDGADGGFPPPAAARYTGAPNRRILGARMRRLALLTLILVVAACRASAAEYKLFAWRVAGDPGTVYLLGSIHVGKPDLYPLPQPIEQAFAGSAELVEEIDMSGGNLALLQQQILQRGLYTGGDKLENHLSPTTRAAVAAYLQRTGLAPTALSAMRPWLADIQILATQLQALGFAPQYAIDQHFLDEAVAAKKPVAGLETIDFQVDLLSGLPADLQDKLVFSELVDADNLAGDAAALVQAWRTGDTAGLEATATRAEREHPELQPLTEAVVYKRNAAIARQIADFLKTPKIRFVVVGSLHLVGERGILKLLADKGYRIEQLRVQ
jgi:uncharacterized protein YbaP (TraB family)